ncbi:MAG: DUF6527 family protein [Methylophilus sp.]|nr:DUF6527 family protein [Methylophilus sp.]
MSTNERAKKLVVRAQIERISEAGSYRLQPGEALIVYRGTLRSILFNCPDGCCENITINLDPRAGKAWRLYETKQGLTVFPSIWRDTGCKSHFIVYKNHIIWCDYESDYSDSGIDLLNDALDTLVLKYLSNDFQSYIQIAEKMDEIPWDVRSSCIRLTNTRRVIQGKGFEKEYFKLNGS